MNLSIQRVKINLILLLAFLSFGLIFVKPTTAVCPICTVAVGAGLGLSRYFGIDDAVSSIWIGGLLMSVSFWTVDWLGKKNYKFSKNLTNPQLTITAILFWYILTLIPLWVGNVIGHPLNTILGIDKIIFGTGLGSFMFLVGMWTDKKLRALKGKQLFNYQKVAFPVISLVLTSLLVYYYGGYLY